jgi:hypothetical protein
MRRSSFRKIMSISLGGIILFWSVPKVNAATYPISMPKDLSNKNIDAVARIESEALFKIDEHDMSSHFHREEIIVIVQSENRPPELAPIGNKKIKAGETLTVTISASDPDGDPLAYSARNLPTHAAFIAGTKTFAWTPTQEQVGIHRVRFIVTDNGEPFKLDFEEIVITVIPASLPPIFLPVGPT